LLVEKRDGQVEWLRATKLARSILLALHAEDEGEEWRALDLAATVLAGLRTIKGRRRRHLTTDEVAGAVTEVLLATGFPGAAQAYVAVASERARRARSFAANEAAVAVAPAGARADGRLDGLGAPGGSSLGVPGTIAGRGSDSASPDTLRN